MLLRRNLSIELHSMLGTLRYGPECESAFVRARLCLGTPSSWDMQSIHQHLDRAYHDASAV